MRYADCIAPQTRISRRLYEAVKLHARTARELSVEIGMDESALSRMLGRHRSVRLNDPRIVKLGKLVGLHPADLFEPVVATTRNKR